METCVVALLLARALDSMRLLNLIEKEVGTIH